MQLARQVLQFLRQESWNPLFGGMIAGLVGAIIGGQFALRALSRERKREGLAAGRALSAELEQNVWAAAAIVGGRFRPRDYLSWRPTLARSIFDGKLALLSELLKPNEFRSMVALYAKATASFAMLETQAQRGAPITVGAVRIFTEHAEEFAVAAGIVASQVWPKVEQVRLSELRQKVLRETLKDSEPPLIDER